MSYQPELGPPGSALRVEPRMATAMSQAERRED
jgi:hypothetical protein